MKAAAGKSPNVKLNNGAPMPALGFGVYRIEPERTTEAVLAAFAAGYRLVDTAAAYNNEREVGEAVRQSGIPRSEIFVTSKLWLSEYGREAAERAFDRSLDKLGLDYADMFLLHWPYPRAFDRTLEAYRVLERELEKGRVRAVGVCNHSAANLERLMAETEIVPAVNQVELHPFFTQRELARTHERLGVVTQAWSPLGGVNVYDAAPGKARRVLSHPVVVAIAEKMGKTPGQIVLRWHMQHGYAAIPKTVNPGRMAENMAVFDFELSAGDMAAIDGLDTGVRGGDDPQFVDTETYPVVILP